MIDGCGMKDVIGYVNEELIKSKFKKVEALVSTNVAQGKVSTSTMVKYINHRDWIGYQFHALICSSFTSRTIQMPKEVQQRKKELLKKYEKELAAGDPKVAEIVEKELVSLTEKLLDDDPGMDFFKSGSKVETGNNLKNIVITRGPVMNPNTGEYEFINNSLMEGMEKEKFTAHSNALILGSYPKAVGTADSGYLSKQLSAAMQTEIIDIDGSDCGTRKALDINITESNAKDFINRNIKFGDGYLLLTPDNIGKYIGKEVKLFSPMYCTGDKICRKCAGSYNNPFIGLDTNKIATTLTNLNMKKFHNNTIKSTALDPKELLILNRKQGVLGTDGKNIILNDKYMEIYVPEFYFDKSYNFAEDLGDHYNVFGILNVGIFNNGGTLGYMDTLNIPSNIMLNVYEMEYRTVFLPGYGNTNCRVVKYYEKNQICKNFLIQDSLNAQTFLRCVIYGKLPNTIPYSKSIQIWHKNQAMNSVNFGVPSIIQEVVLRVMYRNKDNVAEPFSKVIGRADKRVSDYDYKMVSVRQVCQYASTFSAITFEDFDSMVTTSVNREREHRKENDSPVEALFKM